MLKQQIDTIQDRSHADIDSVRGEIGRLFTLTQWFIGLMFTIALGVFGLALSNLRRATEKPVEKQRAAAA
jgi:type IV secretory pathway TrbL component